MVSLIEFYLKQLNEEAETTCKMLAMVPDDKYDWAPYAKSMDIRRLATHIAELPTWITMALNTDELDFENNAWAPTIINNTEELMALFERSLIDGRTQLVANNEHKLIESWILRSGDQIYSKNTKGETIRMALSQIIHHRAQLGVYLHLLDILIPSSYGPSANEQFEVIEVEAV
ncbi:DinB family protein [Mucilaginibacter glaciei]|uniref:DinB family protein n=1 Tax=Mucilaginibacter glaciei TaxID=2772109 RepID=A0A926NVQ1_9SPHI|nr:DinB family protein [Mucilaginibacter glaciei]MBD1392668.1 DinB family protein [Mucilaginibacter glaciei]